MSSEAQGVSLQFLMNLRELRTRIMTYEGLLGRIKEKPDSYARGSYRNVATSLAEMYCTFLEMCDFMCDQNRVNADSDSMMAGDTLLNVVMAKAKKSVTTDKPEEPPKENT